MFEECLIGEEMAFGCSGMGTAIGGSNLGVSANDTVGYGFIYQRYICLYVKNIISNCTVSMFVMFLCAHNIFMYIFVHRPA